MQSREMTKIAPAQLEIIRRHIAQYPVKLGSLAKELGISQIKVGAMSTGMSGQICREGGEYIIRINRNESRERQRFTIAHEISHFLLHRQIIDSTPDGITDSVLYRSGAPERIEYEANRLAADLVMPLDLVSTKLREEFRNVVTDATLEDLAESFEVSKAAMEIRLSTLVAA